MLSCLDTGSTIETHKGVSLEALIGLLDTSSGVFRVEFPRRISPFGVVEIVVLNVHSGWIRNFMFVRRSEGFESGD